MLGFYPISSVPIASIDRSPINYTFNLDKGSYLANGYQISIILNKSFNIDKGSYLLNGFNVNLQLSISLSVNKGIYTIIGKNVNIIINKKTSHGGGSGGRTKRTEKNKEHFDRLLKEDIEMVEITKAYLEYIL